MCVCLCARTVLGTCKGPEVRLEQGEQRTQCPEESPSGDCGPYSVAKERQTVLGLQVWGSGLYLEKLAMGLGRPGAWQAFAMVLCRPMSAVLSVSRGGVSIFKGSGVCVCGGGAERVKGFAVQTGRCQFKSQAHVRGAPSSAHLKHQSCL